LPASARLAGTREKVEADDDGLELRLGVNGGVEWSCWGGRCTPRGRYSAQWRIAPGEPAATAACRRGPGAYPEIDCVRHILSHRIAAAAERRARALGVGADRVLVGADAITEEAYLTALAHSFGTSYERFDAVARADCPLDDDALIAAAAGLLPLRRSRQDGEGSGLVWIIAPRGMTARRLADPSQATLLQWPDMMRSFRLTSSERPRQFVVQQASARWAAAPPTIFATTRPCSRMRRRPPAGKALLMPVLALFAFLFFALAPVAMIEALSGLICALFLAAAILRLWSACFAGAERAHRRRAVADLYDHLRALP
jgi:glycosyltransferase XagB